MDTTFVERLETSLVEKHQNLSDWLQNAPVEDKDEVLACCGDACLQPHMEILEASLDHIHDLSMGVCRECGGSIEPYVLESDYTTTVCLECMAEEEKNALEADLELSRSLQQALLPQEAPTIPGLDVAVFSRPAQVLSGDYFDFFQLRNGDYGMVVADAMGHGLAASFLMTSLQTAVRALAPDSTCLEDILERINRLYIHNINFTIFATAFLGCFDPATRTLKYCNAGHNPPVHYHQQKGSVDWLSPTAAALGVIEDYHIQSEACSLSAGDTLLIYSDGVTEASNLQGEEFGRERLAEIVKRHSRFGPAELIQVIRQNLHAFTGGLPLVDDTTILACKAVG